MGAWAPGAHGRRPGVTDLSRPPTPTTVDGSPPGLLAVLARHPRTSAVAAASGLSASGITYVLSGVSPSTATFFRCLYALPFLWLVARREDALHGPRPARLRADALLAGVFFAVDLILFHHSIRLLGAGLATVMSNLQVVIVLAAAWILWGERPSRQQLLGVPLALIGVVLISGVLGGEAYGVDPVLGTILGLGVAAAYSAYLLLIRRGRDPRRAAGPITDATLSCAITASVAGLVTGELALIPAWPSAGWLIVMALVAQLFAGLALAVALPRLPAVTTSLILLIQPVLAVVLAIALLEEAPSSLQLIGVGLVLIGVVAGSVGRVSRGGGSTPMAATMSAP
jgi:drug/metabolite transporter (DMT)-like permease